MTLRTAAFAASLVAAGCHSPVGQLTGQASDEWVRSYELRPDGEIQVSASNGTIELEGCDGKTVEVRAERIAHAVNDEAARELVSKIEISEEVTPDRVAVRTEGHQRHLDRRLVRGEIPRPCPHSVVARLRVDRTASSRRRRSTAV